jgi:predicted ATPase/DNA-binding CsgD family transcriptional regulator
MSTAVPAAPHLNLPTPFTPLIGREQEQIDLCALLGLPVVRLVTLTGPGGVGKTRLAIQVAADVADRFRDGVCFVPLDPIRDADLVVPSIAQSLEVRDVGGSPLFDALVATLKDRHLLLLLDNFEQVEGAAPAVADLLAACPAVKVLVTSRVSLEVYGEREYPLSPLPLPLPTVDESDTRQLSAYAAVRLFVERAVEVRPGFALTPENAPEVVEICRRLDGLPLAIELAAARVKVLTAKALLDRLTNRLQVLTSGDRDLPARLQTMRDAIAWSHDLLTETERALFRRLAAFAGGFTLEAAEAVASRAVEESSSREAGAVNSSTPRLLDSSTSVLDGIADLVDESLVRQFEGPEGETRFDMFQTIHEFAVEQLAASAEEESVRHGHADYFASLGEQASAELTGPHQVAWLDRLEVEHDNFRAALEWAIGREDAALAQRIAGPLWRFWWTRGHLNEGRQWLERAVALGDATPTAARTAALYGAGALAELQADYERAVLRYRESRDAAATLGEQRLVAQAVDALGNVAHDRGDYEESIRLHQEAQVLFRQAGDRRGLAGCLHNLGTVYYYQGDVARAEALYGESLALLRAIGDERAVSVILGNLGVLAFARGDHERARQLHEESVRLLRGIGDELAAANALTNLGETLQQLGDLAQATALNEEALVVFNEFGVKRNAGMALYNLGQVAHAQGDGALAARRLADGLALLWEMRDLASTAQVMEALGVEASALGDPRLGARLLAAADALLASIGARRVENERVEHDANVATVRAAAGDVAFAAAWAEGEAASVEAMVAAALTVPALATAAPDDPADQEAARRAGLTRRELDALRLFVAGKSNHEIAAALAIGVPVATTLVANLYTKLGADSRAGVTAYAFKNGLV